MTELSKTESNKVVQLNVERNNTAQAQIVLTRLPAAIHSLREKARQQLQGLLRDLFERVDDAMFELADKANNNHDQNIFFDSMREVRIRRRAMETNFFRNIDISFAQLLDHNAYRDETSRRESAVSLDDLSLVKNDELEEQVASDAMVSKANEQFAEKIQHLTLRIDHLVPIKVYQKNNPLGVDVICMAFSDATGILQIDVKAKLVLFKLFDNLVMVKLGALYDVLNKTLVDANILPSLQTAAPKKVAKQTSVANHYGAGISADLHAANNRVDDNTGGLNSQGSYDEQTHKVLHDLRDLLGGRAARPAVQNSAEEISTSDLLSILSQAQQSAEGATATAQGTEGVRQLLNNLLRTEEKKATAINQVDDDVINLVSMMFEFILDDRNLAAPMKVLIGRLQIPMVKVAIADKSFFSKGGHPARRLLNEMAMACLGWQESNDEVQRKDGLFTKMEQTVQSVLADFETDMSLFERLLVDFRSFLEKEKRRAQILEQRTLDAEDGKAKAERARAQVDAELNRVCQGRDLPPSVTKLMREAWANVMFITSLKRGVDSPEWQDCSRTAQQLVWSVCAAMDKDNRQRLLRLVPELLQKLRVGLESISFSPFEMTQLFKQLEAVHLARLRGDAGPKTVPSVVAAPEAAVSLAEPLSHAAVGSDSASVTSVSPLSQVVEPVRVESSPSPEIANQEAAVTNESSPEESATKVAALDEEPVVVAQKADAQHLALVNNITQGTWFEMQGEAGEKYRCRLAAIIRSVGKYIFVNRSGMKVAEESRESLAIALQNKRLTILDDGMLFDRALEAVIGTLRDQRSLS